MKKAFIRKIPNHHAEAQLKLVSQKISDPRDIWTHGQGAETIHTLTDCFMRRPGPHELYLGMDVRILGDAMKDIRVAIERLTEAGVSIIDLLNPEDNTLLKMYHRAQAALRWNGDRRHQKRKGKKGGDAKATAMQVRRDAIMNKDVVIRLCAHPKLTWQDKADILGPPFSISSLQRHYRV